MKIDKIKIHATVRIFFVFLSNRVSRAIVHLGDSVSLKKINVV